MQLVHGVVCGAGGMERKGSRGVCVCAVKEYRNEVPDQDDFVPPSAVVLFHQCAVGEFLEAEAVSVTVSVGRSGPSGSPVCFCLKNISSNSTRLLWRNGTILITAVPLQSTNSTLLGLVPDTPSDFIHRLRRIVSHVCHVT